MGGHTRFSCSSAVKPPPLALISLASNPSAITQFVALSPPLLSLALALSAPSLWLSPLLLLLLSVHLPSPPPPLTPFTSLLLSPLLLLLSLCSLLLLLWRHFALASPLCLRSCSSCGKRSRRGNRSSRTSSRTRSIASANCRPCSRSERPRGGDDSGGVRAAERPRR